MRKTDSAPDRDGVKHTLRCMSAALILLLAAAPAATAEVREIDKSAFLAVVEARLAAGDYTGKALFAPYFNTGDQDYFSARVRGWLNGVVVDPGYLEATSGPGVPGFTQPSGWTGFAQSLVQALEQRYNGYIILASFDPNNPTDVVTATHEAIHAFAFAAGTSIDDDAAGAPEYLSGNFIDELLPTLHQLEMQMFGAMFKLAWECKYDDFDYQKNAWLTRLSELQYRYVNFSAHDRAVTRELLAMWKGRIDWDGYIAEVEHLGDDDDRSKC